MRCLHRRAPHVRIFPIVKASPSIDVWEKNHIASTFPIGELAPRMDFGFSVMSHFYSHLRMSPWIFAAKLSLHFVD